jgi:hypothetical protein
MFYPFINVSKKKLTIGMVKIYIIVIKYYYLYQFLIKITFSYRFISYLFFDVYALLTQSWSHQRSFVPVRGTVLKRF